MRPGGQLAITTWGPDVFEPGNTAFWSAVQAVRPELYKGFNPWERISEAASLRAMLKEGGVAGAGVLLEPSQHAISGPEDWWTIVMGSGYRGTVDLLTDPERRKVRDRVLAGLCDGHVRAIETPVLYSPARKPPA